MTIWVAIHYCNTELHFVWWEFYSGDWWTRTTEARCASDLQSDPFAARDKSPWSDTFFRKVSLNRQDDIVPLCYGRTRHEAEFRHPDCRGGIEPPSYWAFGYNQFRQYLCRSSGELHGNIDIPMPKGRGFSLDDGNPPSIKELSPCVPRFLSMLMIIP